MKIRTFICLFVAFVGMACRVSKKIETSQTSKVYDVVHVRDSIIRIAGNEVGYNFDYATILKQLDSLQRRGQKPQISLQSGGLTSLRIMALPNGQIRAECHTADSLLKIVLKERSRSETNESKSSQTIVRYPWWMIPVLVGGSALFLLLILAIIYLLIRR